MTICMHAREEKKKNKTAKSIYCNMPPPRGFASRFGFPSNLFLCSTTMTSPPHPPPCT